MSDTSTKTAMTLSDSGLLHLKSVEGFSAKLYDDDGGGHCTIGYGHLVHHGLCDGKDEREKGYKDGTNSETAGSLLKSDVSWAVDSVNELVTVTLTQGQFDALVSFVFNVGSSAFKSSTLRTVINASEFDKAPDEFRRWNKSSGKKVQGLVNRREAEIKLFEGE